MLSDSIYNKIKTQKTKENIILFLEMNYSIGRNLAEMLYLKIMGQSDEEIADISKMNVSSVKAYLRNRLLCMCVNFLFV